MTIFKIAFHSKEGENENTKTSKLPVTSTMTDVEKLYSDPEWIKTISIM